MKAAQFGISREKQTHPARRILSYRQQTNGARHQISGDFPDKLSN